MSLSEKRKNTLRKRINKARTTEAPENAVGQWIASFFEAGVSANLRSIIENLPDDRYNMKLPKGKRTWHLVSKYGESKQIDYVISDKDGQPVIIIEDKWLKDQRHLKDKGSWILALRAVQDANPSVRGIIAVLAGEWNKATRDVLRQSVYVFHIPTETVYDNLKEIGIEVKINKEREAFEDPAKLLNNILDVVESKLDEDIDIIEEVGKKITEDIADALEKVIKKLLYPEKEEVAEKYEFLIKTTWGRVKLVKGKCVKKDHEELIREVRERVEPTS